MIAGALLVAAGAYLAAQCSGAACPDPCTACAFQPEQGTDPSTSEYPDLFRAIAQRQGAADLPDVRALKTGPDRASGDAEFPCTLLPAVSAVESSMTEFCGGDGPTVISFDCGFGVMQVTSGASSYPGIQARADINIAAGADIIAAKWNDDGDFGGHFGDSDPSFLESWYFAVWAYNGFIYGNNPNNPDFPANRPPFHGPASLSRGSYPYQELVWGFLQFPLNKGGVDMWTGVPVSYPSDIPNQSGLFSVSLPLPQPAHADNCVEQCPPIGCPPADQRTLILDDADASFTITGDANVDASGGFRDQFRDAAIAPAGAPTVRAHFEGTAPSSGTFDVAAFVPLDPATCTDVHVVVHGLGAALTFSSDQSALGGDFTSLGQVALRQGDTISVDVDNGTSDSDASHRVGIDAFRFTWVGDGTVADGGSCGSDVDCAGDDVCASGTCAPAGTPGVDAGTPEDDAGTADDDAGPGVRRIFLPVPSGCGCGSTSTSAGSGADAALALGLGATLLLWRRRMRLSGRRALTSERAS